MALWAALLFGIPGTDAAELYYTDFEAFTPGDDQWVGTDGWEGNNQGVGVHGIHHELIPGLGNTAFLGGVQPGSRLVSVFRPVPVDPVAMGTPVVEFEALLGIQDSTTGRRDSFFVTFYNQTGNRLGAIRFNNQDNSSFGVWRDDGQDQFYTDMPFIRGHIHLVYARIDFARNRWSADLDGIPLFTEAPFNATGQALNLYGVAAEWQLTSQFLTNYGDNWMLVADWLLQTVPAAGDSFRIDGVGPAAYPGPVVLSWNAETGFVYRVEHRDGPADPWLDDLPGSAFSNATGTLYYTDLSGGSSLRHYRVRRTEE